MIYVNHVYHLRYCQTSAVIAEGLRGSLDIQGGKFRFSLRNIAGIRDKAAFGQLMVPRLRDSVIPRRRSFTVARPRHLALVAPNKLIKA
jgi:hypothetical protein